MEEEQVKGGRRRGGRKRRRRRRRRGSRYRSTRSRMPTNFFLSRSSKTGALIM